MAVWIILYQQKRTTMKTKIYTLLFLLIIASVLRAGSQTANLSPVHQDEQKVTHIKAFESRYFDNKVYLHITVNGNPETKIVAVERSLDATHFEVIGYVKIYGSDAQADLAYYFTDESPVIANLYYRLSDYSFNNEPVYSETISVIPVDENKVSTGIIATTSNSDEQTEFYIGGTK